MPVAQFLTDAWLAEVGRALGPTRPGPAELTIQQVVTAAPGGEVRYHVEIRGDQLTVRPGQAAAPDATITEDYDTAAAIAQGELSPQEALLAGRIRIAGDVGALLQHRDRLASLDPIPAPLRAGTTF